MLDMTLAAALEVQAVALDLTTKDMRLAAVQTDLLAAAAQLERDQVELLHLQLQEALLHQELAAHPTLADARLEPTTNAQLDLQEPRDQAVTLVWTAFQDWTEFQEKTLRTSLQNNKTFPLATTALKDLQDHQDQLENQEAEDTRELMDNLVCLDVMDNLDILESKDHQDHPDVKAHKVIQERRELMDASLSDVQDQRDNASKRRTRTCWRKGNRRRRRPSWTSRTTRKGWSTRTRRSSRIWWRGRPIWTSRKGCRILPMSTKVRPRRSWFWRQRRCQRKWRSWRIPPTSCLEWMMLTDSAFQVPSSYSLVSLLLISMRRK